MLSYGVEVICPEGEIKRATRRSRRGLRSRSERQLPGRTSHPLIGFLLASRMCATQYFFFCLYHPVTVALVSSICYSHLFFERARAIEGRSRAHSRQGRPHQRIKPTFLMVLPPWESLGLTFPSRSTVVTVEKEPSRHGARDSPSFGNGAGSVFFVASGKPVIDLALTSSVAMDTIFRLDRGTFTAPTAARFTSPAPKLINPGCFIPFPHGDGNDGSQLVVRTQATWAESLWVRQYSLISVCPCEITPPSTLHVAFHMVTKITVIRDSTIPCDR